MPAQPRAAASQALTEVATPQQKTIAEVSQFLNVAESQVVKTLIVMGEADENGNVPLIALVLRGDHSLNEIKAEKIQGVASPLAMATDEAIKAALGCAAGSIGPVNMPLRVIVDRSASVMADFVCGANKDDIHLTGVNWERDVAIAEIADLRNVVEGDASPDGNGTIEIKRGIEVGHIFKLGNKYSSAMNATVLNENGKATIMEMGCYGIGVSRVVAAAIEQNHDENGIIWPNNIAPFHVAVVPLNMHKSPEVAEAAEKLYNDLKAKGLDVLLDDRNERPGVKFADMELMGLPHRVVISDRGLKNGTVEYKGRRDESSQDLSVAEIVDFVTSKLAV